MAVLSLRALLYGNSGVIAGLAATLKTRPRSGWTNLITGQQGSQHCYHTNTSDRGRGSVSAGCNPVASGLVGSNPTSLTIQLGYSVIGQHNRL